MKLSTLLSILSDNVRQIVATVENEFASLDDATLNFKHSPECWSILECVEHLNKYNRFYNREFEKAIANSRHRGAMNEARSTWLGRKFIRMMHPDTGKKSKTLKHMDPVNGDLDETVVDEFLEHQRKLLQILMEAHDLDLNKTKIPVEFFRLLKMNLGDALQFVIVHQQRHVIQARQASALHTPALVV